MKELQTIANLTNALKVIPGIGNKSAERIAYEFIKMNPEKVDSLINSIQAIKKDLSICPICGSYMENNKCQICLDSTRDDSLLVVVTSYKDVIALERLSSLHAFYHVLNGSISPSNGITASDININKLIQRIKNNHFKEIILATDPTIDGETTALYISEILKDIPDLIISRLGYGLPMGANLDFADELTLSHALKGRTIYKK